MSSLDSNMTVNKVSLPFRWPKSSQKKKESGKKATKERGLAASKRFGNKYQYVNPKN
jgi:hypothetical protein